MGLTEGERLEVKAMAREIVKEVCMEHIQACPHGQSFALLKAKFVGICVGVGVGSGGLAAALLKLMGG